jgi:ketosteroid isomerase-like protein
MRHVDPDAANHHYNQGKAGMKINTLVSAVLATTLLTFMGPAGAADDPKVAAEVMALARAQWAAEIAGKSVAEQSVDTAEDYTEFNPDFPTRLEGKALGNRLVEAQSSDGSKSLAADMVNPKVQVYGDTAILTYNFVGVTRDKDGKTSPSAAKSTRVYAKTGGEWLLVHANFAPAASKY